MNNPNHDGKIHHTYLAIFIVLCINFIIHIYITFSTVNLNGLRLEIKLNLHCTN